MARTIRENHKHPGIGPTPHDRSIHAGLWREAFRHTTESYDARAPKALILKDGDPIPEGCVAVEMPSTIGRVEAITFSICDIGQKLTIMKGVRCAVPLQFYNLIKDCQEVDVQTRNQFMEGDEAIRVETSKARFPLSAEIPDKLRREIAKHNVETNAGMTETV